MKRISLLLLWGIALTMLYACEPCDPDLIYCSEISTPNLLCTPVSDTFIDNRDGKQYQTVKICNQTWLAEDLRYDTPDTIANGEDVVINNRYLYNWYSSQQACPNGWHLPTVDEWHKLCLNVGMTPADTSVQATISFGCGMAQELMSTTGWGGRGTNSSGFNAKGHAYGNNKEWVGYYTPVVYIAPQSSDDYGNFVLINEKSTGSCDNYSYLRDWMIRIEELLPCRCIKD